MCVCLCVCVCELSVRVFVWVLSLALATAQSSIHTHKIYTHDACAASRTHTQTQNTNGIHNIHTYTHIHKNTNTHTNTNAHANTHNTPTYTYIHTLAFSHICTTLRYSYQLLLQEHWQWAHTLSNTHTSYHTVLTSCCCKNTDSGHTLSNTYTPHFLPVAVARTAAVDMDTPTLTHIHTHHTTLVLPVAIEGTRAVGIPWLPCAVYAVASW